MGRGRPVFALLYTYIKYIATLAKLGRQRRFCEHFPRQVYTAAAHVLYSLRLALANNQLLPLKLGPSGPETKGLSLLLP